MSIYSVMKKRKKESNAYGKYNKHYLIKPVILQMAINNTGNLQYISTNNIHNWNMYHKQYSFKAKKLTVENPKFPTLKKKFFV